MKKILACLLILCMMACVFCACTDEQPEATDANDTAVDTVDGTVDSTDDATDDATDGGNEETEPVEETFDLGTDSPDPEGDGNYTPNY